MSTLYARDAQGTPPSVRELRSELRDATRTVGRGPQGDLFNIRHVNLAEEETATLILPGLGGMAAASRANSAAQSSSSGGSNECDPALEKFWRKLSSVGGKIVAGAAVGSAANAARKNLLKNSRTPLPPPPVKRIPLQSQALALQQCQMVLDLPQEPAVSTHELIRMARTKYRTQQVELALPQSVPKSRKTVMIEDDSPRLLDARSEENAAAAYAERAAPRRELLRSKSEGRIMAQLRSSMRAGTPQTTTQRFCSPMTSKCELANTAVSNLIQQRALPPIRLPGSRAGELSSFFCASEMVGRNVHSRASLRRSRSAFNISMMP